MDLIFFIQNSPKLSFTISLDRVAGVGCCDVVYSLSDANPSEAKNTLAVG